jgi:hypothetical protein
MEKHEKIEQLLLIFVPIGFLLFLLGVFIYFDLFANLVDMAKTIQQKQLIKTTEQASFSLWQGVAVVAGLALLFFSITFLIDYWLWRKKLAALCPICGKNRPDAQQISFSYYLKRRHDQKCQCFPSIQLKQTTALGHWKPK